MKNYDYLSMSFEDVQKELNKLDLTDKLIFLRHARKEYLSAYYLETFIPHKAPYLAMYQALGNEFNFHWNDFKSLTKNSESQTVENSQESNKKKVTREKTDTDEMVTAYIRVSLITYPDKPTLEKLSEQISNITNWSRKLKDFNFMSLVYLEIQHKLNSKFKYKGETKEKLIQLSEVVKVGLPPLALEKAKDDDLIKLIKGNKKELEYNDQLFDESINRGDEWGHKQQTDDFIDHINV